jgi:hypothetical protein
MTSEEAMTFFTVAQTLIHFMVAMATTRFTVGWVTM